MDRINLMFIAYYLGQLTDQDLTPGDVELISELVDKFSKWEEENVMPLKNGWQDYMDAGGNSYEDEIVKWVKEFIEKNWKLWNM